MAFRNVAGAPFGRVYLDQPGAAQRGMVRDVHDVSAARASDAQPLRETGTMHVPAEPPAEVLDYADLLIQNMLRVRGGVLVGGVPPRVGRARRLAGSGE